MTCASHPVGIVENQHLDSPLHSELTEYRYVANARDQYTCPRTSGAGSRPKTSHTSNLAGFLCESIQVFIFRVLVLAVFGVYVRDTGSAKGNHLGIIGRYVLGVFQPKQVQMLSPFLLIACSSELVLVCSLWQVFT